jgi:hypothetical protein
MWFLANVLRRLIPASRGEPKQDGVVRFGRVCYIDVEIVHSERAAEGNRHHSAISGEGLQAYRSRPYIAHQQRARSCFSANGILSRAVDL